MKNIILLILLGVGISSCSKVIYVSDPLENTDFTIYNTYGTEEHCDESISSINMQRIKNSVEVNLRKNGYVVSGNPDILVKYFVKDKTKKIIEECSDYYDRWTGGETCRERVVNYEEGSIVIDFIDTNKNTIIWHGAAKGPSFNKLSDPGKDIDRMVSKLINLYFLNGQVAS